MEVKVLNLPMTVGWHKRDMSGNGWKRITRESQVIKFCVSHESWESWSENLICFMGESCLWGKLFVRTKKLMNFGFLVFFGGGLLLLLLFACFCSVLVFVLFLFCYAQGLLLVLYSWQGSMQGIEPWVAAYRLFLRRILKNKWLGRFYKHHYTLGAQNSKKFNMVTSDLCLTAEGSSQNFS